VWSVRVADNSLIGAEMFRFGVQKGWICDSEYTVIFLSKLLFFVHKNAGKQFFSNVSFFLQPIIG